MNAPTVEANAGHCTGERYEELVERISEHSGSESGRQQFAERFVGPPVLAVPTERSCVRFD
jgi:hypothetical protein